MFGPRHTLFYVKASHTRSFTSNPVYLLVSSFHFVIFPGTAATLLLIFTRIYWTYPRRNVRIPSFDDDGEARDVRNGTGGHDISPPPHRTEMRRARDLFLEHMREYIPGTKVACVCVCGVPQENRLSQKQNSSVPYATAKKGTRSMPRGRSYRHLTASLKLPFPRGCRNVTAYDVTGNKHMAAAILHDGRVTTQQLFDIILFIFLPCVR